MQNSLLDGLVSRYAWQVTAYFESDLFMPFIYMCVCVSIINILLNDSDA